MPAGTLLGEALLFIHTWFVFQLDSAIILYRQIINAFTMEEPSQEKNWNRYYWRVFWLGLIYILLLGLFTYLFNNPL